MNKSYWPMAVNLASWGSNLLALLKDAAAQLGRPRRQPERVPAAEPAPASHRVTPADAPPAETPPVDVAPIEPAVSAHLAPAPAEADEPLPAAVPAALETDAIEVSPVHKEACPSALPPVAAPIAPAEPAEPVKPAAVPKKVTPAAKRPKADKATKAVKTVKKNPAAATLPALAHDPGLDTLRDKVTAMETRVADLATRKAEMEQLLEEYAFHQFQALGELLGEHLHLQQEVLGRRAENSAAPEDQQAADAAAAEYAAYQQALAAPAPPPAELAEDERKELTALYRATAMRCHPDRVGDTDKDQAHEFFLRTQQAYRSRDLETMRLISRQLAAGALPATADHAAAPGDRLQALLDSLMDKGAELLMATQAIQMQAQYRQARQREHWAEQFASTREQLEDECRILRRQLARC